VPLYSPKQIAQIIKGLPAREIFKACPEVKKHLWGGKFWSDGYFVSTVGAHGNEQMIKSYVQQHGKLENNVLFNNEWR
jgi:putative transposase